MNSQCFSLISDAWYELVGERWGKYGNTGVFRYSRGQGICLCCSLKIYTSLFPPFPPAPTTVRGDSPLLRCYLVHWEQSLGLQMRRPHILQQSNQLLFLPGSSTKPFDWCCMFILQAKCPCPRRQGQALWDGDYKGTNNLYSWLSPTAIFTSSSDFQSASVPSKPLTMFVWNGAAFPPG